MRVSGYFIAGVLVLGTQLNAAPASGSSSAPAAPAVSASPGTAGELSPAMMKAHADEKLAQMHAQFREVSYTRSRARHAQDFIKLTCVDSNAIVMKGLLRLAEDQSTALDQALQQGNRTRVAAAYQRIADAAQECNDAADHAGQCSSATDKAKLTSTNEVHHNALADDPSDDCNILGLAHCHTRPLEYVAWASPFTPN